jgi:hypothetical protein
VSAGGAVGSADVVGDVAQPNREDVGCAVQLGLEDAHQAGVASTLRPEAEARVAVRAARIHRMEEPGAQSTGPVDARREVGECATLGDGGIEAGQVPVRGVAVLDPQIDERSLRVANRREDSARIFRTIRRKPERRIHRGVCRGMFRGGPLPGASARPSSRTPRPAMPANGGPTP